MSGDTVAEQPISVSFPLPKELLACTGFLMVRLGTDFKTHALAELEKAGFSQYDYSVLAVLDEQPRKTQASIADALALDRSQLVGVLDRLEQRRLLARQRDPNDRRRHVVSLTAKGRQQLSRLRLMIDKLDAELLAPLDPASRAVFHALLLRLAGHRDPRCAADVSGA